MKFQYHIKGMHCLSCTEKIKLALSPHVKITTISFDPPVLQIDSEQLPLLSDLNRWLLSAGQYKLHPITEEIIHSQSISTDSKKSILVYYPIFLIIGYIVGVASINNFHAEGINWVNWMRQFMAGFFLVFSAFKLLDLRGFADGYATYDLLAKYWHSYGYVYPFLELTLGILYLTGWLPGVTPTTTILLMGFSSLGVINSLLKKQKFQCACLGTFIKVPLSSVTLIEDLTMLGMAVLIL